MKRIAVLVLLAGVAAWPGAPAANETRSEDLVQSTEVTGERHAVRITQKVRRADGQLPPAVTELQLQFPPGTRVRPGAFPRCGLPALQAKGPAGCARGARIGTGIVRVQVPFRFPHEFAGTLRLYNGTGIAWFSSRHSVLMYVRPQAGPSFVVPGRWEGGTREGRRLLLRLPLPAIPESRPDSYVRLSLRIGARRGRSSFLRAPCPGTYRAAARYSDGSVVTSTDRAKCRRP